MNEGITAEQFKILSALRKEAKEVVIAEYVEILEDNNFTVLDIKYGEPVQQYFIFFKLNGEEYKIRIDKREQIIALRQGHPQKAINYIRNIIADKLTTIFLTETC